MTIQEWHELQPDDVISTVVNNRQILPVKLATKDHNQQWICYRLNNIRQPVEVLTLTDARPEIWRKM